MRLTASGIALARECGYSFRDDVTCPEEPESPERARGTLFGDVIEREVNGRSMLSDAEAARLRALLSPEEDAQLDAMLRHAREWLTDHCDQGMAAEAAFAWDPATDTGRPIARKSHRDYSEAKPGEVCATLDIVSVEDGRRVVVRDWKTTTHAGDVDATDQVEACALFAARAWGYDEARVETLIVTESSLEVVPGRMLDAFDLLDVADRLRELVASIPGAEPREGAHCRGRYCKAITVCPKVQTAVIGQVIPTDSLVRAWKFSPAIESPDHLYWMLAMKSIANEYMDRVGKAITAYVAGGPVRTSEGIEIKQTWRTVPRLNQGALLDLAKRMGATDEEIALCTVSSTESAGVRASKATKRRGKAA